MARRKSTTLAPPVAVITIGVDGRLYWQHVTPEILAVAAALCPNDPGLRQRLAVEGITERIGYERDTDHT
jgi:hypothetical protein